MWIYDRFPIQDYIITTIIYLPTHLPMGQKLSHMEAQILLYDKY